ncbi:MAG: SprT-like domain-containing protein [Deltaproteobacteria bacterium]
MDESTNSTIREHEILTNDWEFSRLSEELYTWFDRFNQRFFGDKLQPPAISFRRTRVNTLGHYVIDRNEFGLKWNININRLYADLPIGVTLATLLHEMVHQWEEGGGKRKTRKNYHTVGFRTKAELLGIPCNQRGVSLAYRDPFRSLLREYGIDLDDVRSGDDPDTETDVKGIPGNSKLKKWTCGCTNVRVAVQDFRAKCLKCGNEFRLCR